MLEILRDLYGFTWFASDPCHYLDLRFCAAPESATAILPPNWREEGGPLVAGLGGPTLGAVAAREAREPEEMEAATRSRSTPGGVDPAPTFARSSSHKGFSVKASDRKEGLKGLENAMQCRSTHHDCGSRQGSNHLGSWEGKG